MWYGPDYLLPLLSNRHHRRNDDFLEGKRENYRVCSVHYYVQQFCTLQCTHIWTDLTVVCWLDLALLWLYCVLQFICKIFGIILCYSLSVYVCFCCVRFSFFSTVPRDWLGRTSPRWAILCWVGRKTLTQSIYPEYLTCMSEPVDFYDADSLVVSLNGIWMCQPWENLWG